MAQAKKVESRPLGLVWLRGAYSVTAVGLRQALEIQAQVHIGEAPPEKEVPSCVVLCTDHIEGLSESIGRVKRLYPETPVLVFGTHVDLPLARAALQKGAQGFIHAGMMPDQIARAITIATKGEVVAPRELIRFLIDQEEPVDLGMLSTRQQEILELVGEGLTNAHIARRLFLSESTVKQHLRAAYKLMGVRNRTEATNYMRKVRSTG